MLSTVDQQILEYTKGDSEVFYDIYVSMESFKHKCFISLRRKLPASISNEDLYAIYDDVFLNILENKSLQNQEELKKFIHVELHSRSVDLLRFVKAEKRQSLNESVTLNSKVSEDSETELIDIIEDASIVDPDINLACEELVSLLKKFRQVNKKNKEYADIIVCNSMLFPNQEEKLKAMCNVLGVEVTPSSLYKKLKRAKNAFKKFSEENI